MEEGDEIKLERYFLRIASINSEEKLERFLMLNLVEAVGMASSDRPEVQKLAIDFLSHVSKRLKSNPKVLLPVEALLERYIDPGRANFSENFLVIYIKMGFSRLPETEQVALLPKMIHSLKGKSKTHQDEIFSVAVPALTSLNSKNRSLWPDLQLESHPVLLKAMLDYIGHILLLPPVSAVQQTSNEDTDSGENSLLVPSGFSKVTYNHVKAFQIYNAAKLDKLKCGLISFLSASNISSTELAFPFLVAMTDGSHSVVSAGELGWKKEFGSESLEDKSTILNLFLWYLGTKSSKTIPEEKQLEPANLRQRIKLMTAFKKSKCAADTFPQNVQVVFESLFGVQASPLKLKVATIDFIACIVAATDESSIGTVCPLLYKALKTQIDKTDNDKHLLSQGYYALGQVGRRCPKLITSNMTLVQNLFDSISMVPDEVGSAMGECLSLWIPIFRDSKGQWQEILEALISSYVSSGTEKTRLLALKYLEHIFEPTHIPSRWSLIVASCDSREEIRREAKRTLEVSMQTGTLPRFCDALVFMKSKISEMKVDKTSDTEFSHLSQIVLFLHACLCKEVSIYCDDYSEISKINSPKIVAFIRAKTDTELWSNSLSIYRDLVWSACQKQPKPDYFTLLTILLWCVPEKMQQSVDTSWIKTLSVGSSNLPLCMVAAEFLSLVAQHLGKVTEEISDAMELAKKSRIDISPGLALVIGFLAARENQVGKKKSVEFLLDAIDLSKPSQLTEAAVCALAEVYRTTESADGIVKSETVESLVQLANSKKESVKPKMKEMAVRALGLVNANGQRWKTVSEGLYAIGEGSPQVDLQFSVGEALLNAAMGEIAPLRRNQWVEEEQNFYRGYDPELHNDNMRELVESILSEKLNSPNRHLRQAALIWLFVLTKSCSTWHPAVVEKLDQCQMAFIDGLAEASDFTQDVASKGLGIVYENGTEKQRERMVDLLVGSLDSGRKLAKPITGDTKIFEGGAIGKTPGGESLSTYKELCSLATEMNKPDLVYKFMQLANHNALWNSKKGAAFGFSTVFKQAQEQLEPYLPKIVPKLYRYQYDPQPKVQAAMRSIWQVVTGTKKGVVDEYSGEILHELINCMTHKEWRTRESSCLALSDLLSGHCDEKMTKRFAELWEILLRVIDDIKESVRVAAMRAITVLRKVTVKFCSKHRGERAADLLGQILPILLEKGLKNAAKEPRAISLHALMALTKESGKELRPYMAMLVPCLLESLSELEPMVLNYLAVRSSGVEQEALDSARAAAAKSSPIMDALGECVRYVDAECLKSVGPALSDMLRSGVGLGSRTGTCSFIVSLCTHCPTELKESQCADKLIKTLTGGLQDRNATVRKQYASTIGYLIRFCGSDAVNNLLKKLKSYCTDTDAPAIAKQSSALVLQSLGQRHPELLKDFGSEIAPFVLLATMNDYKKEESVTDWKAVWEEIWSELTPGTEGGIRIYKTEIIQFIGELLENNPSWTVKADAAKTLRKVVNCIGSQLSFTEAEGILNLLLNSLSGRTWDGKEEIFAALGDTAIECSKELKKNLGSEALEKLNSTLLRECKKQKVVYKIEAVKCAGRTSKALGQPSLADLLKLTSPLLEKVEDLYESDNDEPENVKSENRIAFQCAAVEAITDAASYSICGNSQKCVQLSVKLLKGTFWKVQKATLNLVQQILKVEDLNCDYIFALFHEVSECLVNSVQQSVRKDAVMTLKMLLNVILDDEKNRSLVTPETRNAAKKLISEAAIPSEEKEILKCLQQIISM